MDSLSHFCAKLSEKGDKMLSDSRGITCLKGKAKG